MSIMKRPGFVEDIGAGNDKIIAVPANQYWKLLGIHITLLTTGTAGSREVEIEIRDASANVLTRIAFGDVQMLSSTKRYSAALRLTTEVHIAGEMVFAQLPLFQLIEGFDIRVFDSVDVDVLDTMDVRINRIVSSEH